MEPIKFIVNPAASRGKCARVAESLRSECEHKNLQFDMSFTSGPGDATDIASKAAETFGNIIAVGGDGTVNEVINGIIGTKVKFGIIPVGSGNDFIRVMDLPLRYTDALNIILAGHTRHIDAGKAGERYFQNGLGIGFDAWVVEQSLAVKHLRGSAIYLYAVLKTIYTYNSPMIKLTYNNQVREEKLYLVTAGNGTSLGGGFKLTPFAEVDDGLLDLTIIRDLSKTEVYTNLLGVYFGNHTRMPQVTTDRTKHMLVESEEGFAAHVDGEQISLNLKSLEVKIVPKALEVFVPTQ